MTTVAGSTYDVVNGPAASAAFETPADIAVDQTTGDIYVADHVANDIRWISAGGQVTTLAGTGQSGFTDGPVQDESNFPRLRGLGWRRHSSRPVSIWSTWMRTSLRKARCCQVSHMAIQPIDS